MLSVPSQRYAAQLTAWLKSWTTPDGATSLAKEIGFDVSSFFGRRRKSLRILSELVIVHSALAIQAVNRLFAGNDAKEIVDAFLDCARKEVFTAVEAEDESFKKRYQEHIAAYLKTLSGRSLMGMAMAFMYYLDLRVDHHVRWDLDSFLESFRGGDTEVELTKYFERSFNEALFQLRALGTA